MVRGLPFFNILTLKCAFRHSGVQFCDIVTSKNASDLTFFAHFYLKMCFSPQRRTIFSACELPKVVPDRLFFNIFTSTCAFRHSGVQFCDIVTSKKCFGADVFCTFSLQNVLFATAACNFWCLLSAPSSAPAALTSLLLDWPDTPIYEKTQHFVTSLTFGAGVSSFF